MPTARLIPSTYYLSNSSYLSVSNASNMYANTDSTNYATVTNSRTSTSSYYIYIRGFNFSEVPENAIVSDITIKLKAYHSGASTSTIYCYDGTSQVASAGSATALTTSATVETFSNTTVDWHTLKGYGSDFGIRINCRRSSRNTTSYVYIYGAEIEVIYTVPNPRSITTTLSGNGTISPSGTNTYYDGDEVELVITPTNKSDTVTATRDGTDITSQLVAHGVGTDASLTPDDVTTSGIQSGSSYAEYAVGHSAESPSSSGSGQNMYAPSGSTGYASYSFDFSSIPSGAVIEDIEVRCYGHRESSTISSTYVSKCGIYNGSNLISEYEEFPSTSDSIITLTPTTMPTRADLDNVVIRHYVGYYGGLVRGITFAVTYSTGTRIDHYTYTFTVDADTSIAVTIGGAVQTDTMYIKLNGSYVTATAVYKKINGAWVQQSDLTSVFDNGTNYYAEV